MERYVCLCCDDYDDDAGRYVAPLASEVSSSVVRHSQAADDMPDIGSVTTSLTGRHWPSPSSECLSSTSLEYLTYAYTPLDVMCVTHTLILTFVFQIYIWVS